MKSKSDKIAAALGTTGSVATGSTLVGITAGLSGPAANLGGYATAQIVAGGLGGTFAGPTLATTIATIGGPVVAGAACVVAVGGIIYGGCKLLSRLF